MTLNCEDTGTRRAHIHMSGKGKTEGYDLLGEGKRSETLEPKFAFRHSNSSEPCKINYTEVT